MVKIMHGRKQTIISSEFFETSSANQYSIFKKNLPLDRDRKKSSYFKSESNCDTNEKRYTESNCDTNEERTVESSYEEIENCSQSLCSKVDANPAFQNDTESISIEPLFNITPRSMPESPHRVIEEEFKQNPWAMLVATIFLTKTTAKVAKPWMRRFFADFPTPYDVLNVHPDCLESYFEMLGLRKRSNMIWKMTHQFVSAKWRRASDLCGIGKYGEDAYRIFCLGHTDVEPTDRFLRLYLDWLKTQTDHLEDWSRSDCECLVVDPVSNYYSITLR